MGEKPARRAPVLSGEAAESEPAAEVEWDPRAAIYAALRIAGPPGSPARLAMTAQLAFQLAPLGHLREVTFYVAPGTPLDAIRSALAEVALPQPGTPETAPEPSDALQEHRKESSANSSVREACAGHSGEGLEGREECPPGETRLCGVCGDPFRVNPRHATVHRFCSAGCRSKRRHRLKLGNKTSKKQPREPGSLTRPMERAPHPTHEQLVHRRPLGE